MTMIKKLVVMMLTLSLVLSMGAVAFAVEPEDPNPTEDTEFVGDGCSLTPPVLDEEQEAGITPYGLNPPTSFHNLATAGKYTGSFSNLNSQLYTNKYFNTKNGSYCVRVRSTYSDVGGVNYTIRNYCVTCRKFTGQDKACKTASNKWTTSAWNVVTFPVLSGHSGHYFAPAVRNDGLTGATETAINGDIQVNYTASW